VSDFICKDICVWILPLIRRFRLKKKYSEANKELGRTGAGLTAADLKQNPELNKLLGMYPISSFNTR